ncbi:MAG: hypothetical protein U0T63_00400 [Buchnera aphidicola (Nurudea shiraii)]
MYNLVHYYIPEFKIKKIIGKYNNFILEDIRYLSNERSFFIKKAYLRISFNFFKRFFISIDKILFLGCDIYVKHFSLSMSQKKNFIFNKKFMFFFKIPIVLKDVKINNFSFFTNNIIFKIDNFSGEYVWNGIMLKCLHSEANNVYFKKHKFSNKKNIEFKRLKIKRNVSLNLNFKEILNYFKKWSFHFPIDINLGSFYSKNVYFFDESSFNLHNFHAIFNIINNKISVRRLCFLNSNMKFCISGVCDVNKHFLTNVRIYYYSLEKLYKKESVIICVNGFLFKKLDIIFNLLGFLNARVYVKIEYKKYNSILNMELFAPSLILVKNKEKYTLLEDIKFKIMGNSLNYKFFVDGIINFNFFIPIKVSLLGSSNYSTIYIKKFKCKFLKKSTYFSSFLGLFNKTRYFSSVISNQDKNVLYKKFMIKKMTNNFLKLRKNNDLMLDIMVLLQKNSFTTFNTKSYFFFFKRFQQRIFSLFNHFILKRNLEVTNNFEEKTHVNVVFELKELNNFLSNFSGYLHGNLEFFNFKKNYKYLINVVGKNLVWNYLNISNISCSVVFEKSNNSLFKVQLETKNFFILDFHISFFSLELSNYQYSHNLIIKIFKENHFFYFRLYGILNPISKSQIEIIKKISFFTPFYHLSYNKIFIVFQEKRMIYFFRKLFFVKDDRFEKFIICFFRNIVNKVSGNQKNNIENFFKHWKNLFLFNKFISYKVTLRLNYISHFKKWTLKLDCKEKSFLGVHHICLASIDLREIDRKSVIFGNIVFRNFSTTLLNVFALDIKHFFGLLNGNICFKSTTNNLKLYGNILIKNFCISDFLHFKSIRFNDLILIINSNGFLFSSFIKLESFLKIIFQLEILNLYI